MHVWGTLFHVRERLVFVPPVKWLATANEEVEDNPNRPDVDLGFPSILAALFRAAFRDLNDFCPLQPTVLARRL